MDPMVRYVFVPTWRDSNEQNCCKIDSEEILLNDKDQQVHGGDEVGYLRLPCLKTQNYYCVNRVS